MHNVCARVRACASARERCAPAASPSKAEARAWSRSIMLIIARRGHCGDRRALSGAASAQHTHTHTGAQLAPQIDFGALLGLPAGRPANGSFEGRMLTSSSERESKLEGD